MGEKFCQLSLGKPMPGEECNAMRQERLAERDEGWIKSWEECRKGK